MVKRSSIGYIFLLLTANLICTPPNSVSGIVTDLTPPTFNSASYIIISPTQSIAYVPNTGNNTVSIINTTDNMVTGTVTDLNPETFRAPLNGTFSPDGTTAYICNPVGNSVSIINTASNTVTGKISDPESTFNYPVAMAFIPNSSPTTAYVVNESTNDSGGISIVQNNAVVGTVSGIPASRPYSIAVTPDGTKAFVVDTYNFQVFVIDTNTNSLAQTITGQSLAGAYTIAITPNGSTVYVGTASVNTVVIINADTNTITGNITDLSPATLIYPSDIAVTPDGTTAYVVNYEGDPTGAGGYGTGTVSIINVATNTVTGIVTDLNPPTFYYPWGLGITPDGTKAYVVNPNNTVSIIGLAPNDPVIYPPNTIAAQKTENSFLMQTDIINAISWTAPASGTTPANYKIYRDAALTQLIATVPATTLQYLDHNRQPNTSYTYYIVSVDAQGNVSSPISTTVID